VLCCFGLPRWPASLGWGAGQIFSNRWRNGAGAALAGSGSNLYDRLRGAVIDFVDAGWWPIFNLADLAITWGCWGRWHLERFFDWLNHDTTMARVARVVRWEDCSFGRSNLFQDNRR
jgi:hypothetical protein